MKNKFTAVMVLMFASVNCYSQITYEKSFSISAISPVPTQVIETYDSNYVVCGVADYTFLIKMNRRGDLIMSKSFAPMQFHSVQQANDHGFILSGDGYDTLFQFSGILLMKTNEQGVVQWTKSYYDAGFQNLSGANVRLTSDGGYIISGYVEDTTMKGIIIRTNQNGDTLWTKLYSNSPQLNILDAQVTADGGLIMTGAAVSNTFIAKADSLGNIAWAKTFTVNQCCSYSLHPLVQTHDGCYAFTGTTNDSLVNVALIKIDSAGNMLWAKSFGGVRYDNASSVHETADGGFAIAGSTDSFSSSGHYAYFVKTDSAGSLQWSQQYNYQWFWGQTQGRDAIQTFDGGYLICADYFNAPVLFFKTDSVGNSGCYSEMVASSETVPAVTDSTINIAVQIPRLSVLSPVLFAGTPGTLSTICISDAVAEHDDETFLLSPNPTHDEFKISGLKADAVEIYNSLGEKIYTQRIKTKLQTLNPKLLAGIYFVRVSSGEGNWVRKLVVE